ncbi:MAG: hypothetical protein AB1486_16835 [Planctomycetota bacterium]
MEHYLGVAKKEGITDDEIGTVLSIAMAVRAGQVKATFREVCSAASAQNARE